MPDINWDRVLYIAQIVLELESPLLHHWCGIKGVLMDPYARLGRLRLGQLGHRNGSHRQVGSAAASITSQTDSKV